MLCFSLCLFSPSPFIIPVWPCLCASPEMPGSSAWLPYSHITFLLIRALRLSAPLSHRSVLYSFCSFAGARFSTQSSACVLSVSFADHPPQCCPHLAEFEFGFA